MQMFFLIKFEIFEIGHEDVKGSKHINLFHYNHWLKACLIALVEYDWWMYNETNSLTYVYCPTVDICAVDVEL